MPAQARLITYEDLLTTPYDGRRYEIHEGQLVVAASPDWRHQDVVSELSFELTVYVRERVPGGKVYTAPLDIRLSPHNTYQPDIVYISPARRHVLRATMPVEGAPDMVFEFLSPSTRAYDQCQKAAAYARYCVQEFWLLDPDAATIEVFALRDGAYEAVPPIDDRALSLVLSGFSVDPGTIFAGLA